jgi:hypothetical protein
MTSREKMAAVFLVMVIACREYRFYEVVKYANIFVFPIGKMGIRFLTDYFVETNYFEWFALFATVPAKF